MTAARSNKLPLSVDEQPIFAVSPLHMGIEIWTYTNLITLIYCCIFRVRVSDIRYVADVRAAYGYASWARLG